jgi:hypothetical protein
MTPSPKDRHMTSIMHVRLITGDKLYLIDFNNFIMIFQ